MSRYEDAFDSMIQAKKLIEDAVDLLPNCKGKKWTREKQGKLELILENLSKLILYMHE
jgi:hypothetical protein